jgi:Glycosyltransferase family 87
VTAQPQSQIDSLTRADGLAWAWPLVAVVAASRAVVVLAAVIAETVVARNPLLSGGDGAPILGSLTSWDGWWYLGIVRDGYHVQALAGGYHDYAFLPLYPMLVRVLAAPFPGFEALVAVLLSNALFAVAIGMLVALTSRRFGRAFAIRSAALLAIFPFSAVFSMAYAESLFLVLTLAAFLAAEARRPVPAGIALALATLTRLQGAALVVPLLWLLWSQDHRPRRSWLALALGPITAVAAYAWVVWLTGDVASYGAAQGAWGRAGLGGDPTGTLAGGLFSSVGLVHLVDFAVLLAATFLLVFIRRDRIPGAYASIPVLFIGLVFVSGSIQSIGRLLMPAFSNSWILAGRRGWLGRVGWPVASVALLFALSVAMFAGWFVP